MCYHYKMSFLDAIILGIVEGITEFLPISSTAHLMMTSRILGISQTEFLKSFEIIIQFGAVAALVFVFGKRLVQNPWLWKKVALAFIPTSIIGFLLYNIIKSHLIGNLGVAVLGLIIGGIILIIVEHYISKKTDHPHSGLEEITNKQAVIIGFVQALAVIPGVSRSAATITSTLLFGSSRKAAAEFSFFLAIPTVAIAACYDLFKNIHVVNDHVPVLIIGFLASFISALISIKFLLSFIQTRSFTSFGIYRIIVALLFFAFFV